MRTLRFTKAEGAQNDFVIVEDLDCHISTEERQRFSRQVCHRRKGIGADGTIFIERSADRDFTMVFFNPDGSFGSMCGNGGRCAALFAHNIGVASKHMRFTVLGQEYRADVLDRGVRIWFPPPRVVDAVTVEDHKGLLGGTVHFVHNGAPHLVVFTTDLAAYASLESLDVDHLGKTLRHSADFLPTGTNVNFIEIDEETRVHIRTFEKGVEAETEACGTGTIAAAMIVHAVCGVVPPVYVCTHGGDTLIVDFHLRHDLDGGMLNPSRFADNLSLEGPAVLVFEGVISF